MIGGKRAYGRVPAHRRQGGVSLVQHGSSRRARILRIHGRNQYAVTPSRLHRRKLISDRRITITHGITDVGAVAHSRLKRLGLSSREKRKRRSFIRPHFRICLGRFLRARVQDNAAQDRLPDKRRNFDNAAVR